MSFADMSLEQLVLSIARKSEHTPIFKNARAWIPALYWRSLSPGATAPAARPESASWLDIGDLEALKAPRRFVAEEFWRELLPVREAGPTASTRDLDLQGNANSTSRSATPREPDTSGTFVAAASPNMTPATSQQPCDEKAGLLKKYNEAAQAFASSVAELHRKISITPKAEYDRLRRASDEARLSAEWARLAVEHHIVAHGC